MKNQDGFTVFQSFLENSHPAIQSLESLQNRAMEEFSKVASYFGEDGKSARSEAFFSIFAEFMSKFEVSLFRPNVYLDALKARRYIWNEAVGALPNVL